LWVGSSTKLKFETKFKPKPTPNQIRVEGARALARGLAANATLSRLNLSWNGLEAAGGLLVGRLCDWVTGCVAGWLAGWLPTRVGGWVGGW